MTAKEIAEKAKQNGLHPNTVKYRLKQGEPIESALSRPKKQGRRPTKPKLVKGETLKRYCIDGQQLTLREISQKFGIKYDLLWYRVCKKEQSANSVVQEMTTTKTANGIFELIKKMPEAEQQKLVELIKSTF